MRIFALLLILVIQQSQFAQYNPVTVGVEQGLSQSAVRSIAQDIEGFLWIATWDGLNRYDGHQIKTFNHSPGDAASLSNNNLVNVTFDGINRPWITTMGGEINLHERGKEKFSLLRNKSGEPLRAVWNGFPVKFDDAHMVFLSSHGVVLTRLSDLSSTIMPEVDRSSSNPPNSEVVALFYSQNNLLLVNRSKKVTKIPLEFEIVAVSPINEGVVFILSSTGELFEFSAITGNLKKIIKLLEVTTRSLDGYQLHIDSKGVVRVATSDGAFTLDHDRKIQRDIIIGKAQKEMKRGGVVYAITEDYIGNLWLGTNTGLIKLEKKTRAFFNYPQDGNPNQDKITSMLHLTGSKLLAGSTTGIYSFDDQTGNFNKIRINIPGFESALVYQLLKDRKGSIWAGTKKGLLKLQPAGDEIIAKTIRFKDSLDTDEWINRVNSIVESPDGHLWIGTVRGIIRYSPTSGDYKIYYYHADFGNEGDTYILSLLYDNGILWAGTNSEGLLRINTADMTHTRFSTLGGGTQKLLSDKVLAIHKDNEGNIWIATMGGGVNILSADLKNIKTITTSDGLANNTVYGILEEKSGNIWVSTNKGLSKIDRFTLLPRNYTRSDGPLSYGYNQYSYMKGPDGRFYFGGSNGITIFDPEEIGLNSVKPRVALTDFRIFNKPSIDRVVNKEVELEYDENFFSFEMATMNFEDPAFNTYHWKLEGLTEEWVDAGNRRTVDISNIAPGTYQLKVKGANRDGIWSDETLLAIITVVPPFWRTTWFAILATLLTISSVATIPVFAVKRKMRKEIEELEREKMIMMERTKTRDRIARDLHDDLASTVSGAGLYIQSANSVIGEKNEVAKNMIEKSASLLQEAEQAMRDIVWSVSPEYDSVDNLVLRIRLLAQELCEAAGISFEFNKSGEFSLMLRDEVRRNLYLSTKEALMNAVKHSGADQIFVSVEYSSAAISIRVSDNGTGFRMETQAEKLGGNGLKNIRKRCVEIGAKVEITSTEGEGTTVVINYEIKN